jgi:hypothetical protein
MAVGLTEVSVEIKVPCREKSGVVLEYFFRADCITFFSAQGKPTEKLIAAWQTTSFAGSQKPTQ